MGAAQAVPFLRSDVQEFKAGLTILDEFIEETPTKEVEKTARGILGKYANPELQKLEKSHESQS